MDLQKLRILAAVLVVLAVVAALLGPSMLYVVDERELAVVLQFGRPVAERTEPGLGFKIPFIQEVRRLPKTLQFWGDTPAEAIPDLPTKDDKKIEVIPWAIWRITEPTVFVQRMRTIENAEKRVAQFVRGAIRDVITKYDLAELVRSTNRKLETTADLATLPGPSETPVTKEREAEQAVGIKLGRLKILAEIKEEARRRLSEGAGTGGGGRGIELVDLGISKIDFVESVRNKTFDRWIAERQAISARYINEGEKLKQEILNKTQAEVEKIRGEGQRKANEIRGEAEAQIIREYAKAIEKMGDFYVFIRTLELYKKILTTGDTRLILTTDADFLKLLKQGASAFPIPPAPASPPATAAANDKAAERASKETTDSDPAARKPGAKR